MKHTRLLAFSIAAAALLLSGCGAPSPAAPAASGEAQTAGVPVQVLALERTSISTDNTVSGKIAADSEATIMVGVAAKCTAVYKNAGDAVQAGEAICRLDMSSTLASYNAASISYNSAVQSYQDQSQVFAQQIALYEKNLNDTKALFAIGAASQIEIDQAQLQLDSAIATRNSTLKQLQAGIQSYKSTLDQLSTVLDDVDGNGDVVAPIAGTLVSLSATENNFISNTMPVAVIDGADGMKVTVSVSEALISKLKAGDLADVSVSSAGKAFSASIRAVEQAANPQTKLYAVTLDVPSGDAAGLLSGMFADVTFHTDTSDNTIVVPSDAVLTSGSTQYVFVVENGTTAKYVEVSTGLTGTGVTEITSGLTEGQQLVIVGQTYLTDGDAVRIVSGEE